MQLRNSKKQTGLLLFLILAMGLSLRLWNIGFGLPYFVHPDEQQYVDKALRMLRTLDFNPHYFMNPPLLTYLFAGLFRVIGSGPLDLAAATFAARILCAFFGTATCFLCFYTGRKLISEKMGLTAAALLSVCFLHVKDSHYAVNDVTGLFFIMLAFNFVLNFRQNEKVREAAIAGIFSGLAVAAKYNMGLFIAAGVFLLFERRSFKAVFIFLLCSGAGFFIGCPWALFDTGFFISDFTKQALRGKYPWFGASEASPYFQYLKVLGWGYGYVALGFALAGIAALSKKNRSLVTIAIFPIVYYAVMGQSQQFFARFAIPMLPFLCFLSAVGMIVFADKFKKSGKTVFCIFIILAIAQSAAFSFRHNQLIGREDTRITARKWIRQNIPPSSKAVIEVYGPNLTDFEEEGKSYFVSNVWSGLSKKTLHQYGAEGTDYIITSSFMRDRFTPKKYPDQAWFYSSLDHETEEVYSVGAAKPFVIEVYSPFWDVLTCDRPGPQIRVYKLKK